MHTLLGVKSEKVHRKSKATVQAHVSGAPLQPCTVRTYVFNETFYGQHNTEEPPPQRVERQLPESFDKTQDHKQYILAGFEEIEKV